MVTLDDLLGESAPMVALRSKLARVLERVSELQRLPPILIRGETGTGKTILARLIHRASARSKGPFVEINCAAFQETLLETQLFGRVRHAYTEAGPGGPGLFQTAHRGVLFLDEIGDMSLTLQAKVLTAIADGTVRRVGSNENEYVDVAIVAATNADLEAAVREKRFRDDLYGRIAGITLQIPPLRAREGDIELLAERFLRRECAKYGLPPRHLTAEARAALRGYSWRHNVRELELLIGKVVVMGDASPVTADELGLPRTAPAVHDPSDTARQELLAAWTRTNHNISRMAEDLGISRNAVKRRLDRWCPQLRSDRRPSAPGRPATSSRVAASGAAAPAAIHAEAAAAPSPGPMARTSQDATPTVRPSGLRWERRRVTLMRVSLRAESSASLAVTSRLLEQLVERMRSFGGHIAEMSPRGLVAVFGMEPDEDAPRRGANAGLAIVKTIDGERPDAAPVGRSVAVAIHVARLLLARVDGAVILDEEGKKDAWRRLDELNGAGTDGIALSEDAAVFLGRQFEVVRDAEHGRAAFRLVGRASRDRGLGSTEFVGRQAELSLLQGLLQRAREGRGQLVSIVGDPGIGKTRLVREFVHGLPPDGIGLLKGECVSYGATVPYHLVLDVLRDACGIQEADPPDAIAVKARQLLERLGGASAPWAPYVMNLLCPGRGFTPRGAAPEVVRERTFEALQQLVLAEQARQPLVIVIEDLHWIDRTSADLLAVFVEVVARMRILLVCTTRPGAPLPWTGRTPSTQIALPPLPAEASLGLVESALVGRSVRRDVVEAILARAEGNPFFLEELVRSVRDEDEPSRIPIPETVHEVLTTRILRLSDDDRYVLQSAAVIGRDVPVALLERVGGVSADVMRSALGRLQTAEFVYPTRLGADPTYTFSHALTWDVAYDGMLEEARRAVHGRVVEAIAQLYPDRLLEHSEQLAHHAYGAERWAQALSYLRQAARRALSCSAYRESAVLCRKALVAVDHLPSDPDLVAQAIDVRLELRTALLALGDNGQIRDLLRDAEQLAVAANDDVRLAWVQSFRCMSHWGLGELAQALAAGEQALASGQRLGDPRIQRLAHLGLGWTFHARGRYRKSLQELSALLSLLAEGAPVSEQRGLPIDSVMAHSWIAACHTELGEFEAGLVAGRQAQRLATEMNQPWGLAAAHYAVGVLYMRQENLAEATVELEAGLRLCREYEIWNWFTGLASALGLVRALAGQPESGCQLLRDAVERAETMRSVFRQSLRVAWLAEAEWLAGRPDSARELAERALVLADEHEERGHRVHVLRLLGELALATGDSQAESRLRSAIDEARSLEMAQAEAHSHFGLGRLAMLRLDPGGAREALGRALALFESMNVLPAAARVRAALDGVGG
jgi:transcriptional regulator with AAA-type ATPase domain/tetratricopeptide (TPR) repeat protein